MAEAVKRLFIDNPDLHPVLIHVVTTRNLKKKRKIATTCLFIHICHKFVQTKIDFMRKLKIVLILFLLFSVKSKAQTAKIIYAEIGGPGIASINFDTRFSKKEDGLGGRVGVGGMSISDNAGSRVGIVTIPIGLNYLLGKDGKNYFEVGAGFTYIGGSSKGNFQDNQTFSTSFGNLTLGYRLAPERGGFTFKAQITPIFGRGYFVPYYAGLGFGYKF